MTTNLTKTPKTFIRKGWMNALLMIFGSALGLFLIAVPLDWGTATYSDTTKTLGKEPILFMLAKQVMWQMGGDGTTKTGVPPIAMQIVGNMIIVSALGSLVTKIVRMKKPNFLKTNNRFMNVIFTDSNFWIVNRLIGAIFAFMVVYHKGPSYITSPFMGGAALGLVTLLAIMIPPVLMLQGLMTELGLMELVGTIIAKPFKWCFGLTKNAAVPAIAAMVGPGNAGIVNSRSLINKGFISSRDGNIIATTWACSSLGWMIFTASYLNISDHLGAYLGTIFIALFALAMIMPRIPFINKKNHEFKQISESSNIATYQATGNMFKDAWGLSMDRASKATFKSVIGDKWTSAAFYAIGLQPVIMAWATMANIIQGDTEILNWIGSIFVWIPEHVYSIANSHVAGGYIAAGAADNFLPLLSGFEPSLHGATAVANADQIKFIIGTMSIVSVIFMSEVGSLMIKNGLATFSQMALHFIIRTILGLFIVCALSLAFF